MARVVKDGCMCVCVLGGGDRGTNFEFDNARNLINYEREEMLRFFG